MTVEQRGRFTRTHSDWALATKLHKPKRGVFRALFARFASREILSGGQLASDTPQTVITASARPIQQASDHNRHCNFKCIIRPLGIINTVVHLMYLYYNPASSFVEGVELLLVRWAVRFLIRRVVRLRLPRKVEKLKSYPRRSR